MLLDEYQELIAYKVGVYPNIVDLYYPVFRLYSKVSELITDSECFVFTTDSIREKISSSLWCLTAITTGMGTKLSIILGRDIFPDQHIYYYDSFTPRSETKQTVLYLSTFAGLIADCLKKELLHNDTDCLKNGLLHNDTIGGKLSDISINIINKNLSRCLVHLNNLACCYDLKLEDCAVANMCGAKEQ